MKKPKIGIITDKYHLIYKLSELIKSLKSKAKISFYLEESILLNCENQKFDEDLFFVKGKGKLMIAFARMIEKKTSIPIINSYKAIWLTINRFMNCMLLKKEGVLVPKFSLDPQGIDPPFEDFITKNLIDQKTYVFKPHIEKILGHLRVSDERAINEKDIYHYLFYQEFIKSKWEYKVYVIGDELFYYKQLPLLVNQNKMESRRKIDNISELGEITLKAMKVLNLKLASLDFLISKQNKFYLTDIHSTPNFNYIKGGVNIMIDFLLKNAKN